MSAEWYAGNAANDSDEHQGWLLGHFLPANSTRHSEALEIKWGAHPAGQKRHEWATDEKRTTFVLLVTGRFRVELSTGVMLLQRQGDYLLWGPGTDHTWQAEEDSIVLTARWPSLGP